MSGAIIPTMRCRSSTEPNSTTMRPLARPICTLTFVSKTSDSRPARSSTPGALILRADRRRSEEHTSELQSRQYLVCRLLLEKKKDTIEKRHRSEINESSKISIRHQHQREGRVESKEKRTDKT